MGVSAALYSKNEAILWRAWDIGSVEYTPGNGAYYALVKVVEGQIVLFATWNGQYCVLDKKTGEVLKKGTGDEVLRRHEGFVPLKLTYGLRLCSTLERAIRRDPREAIQFIQSRRDQNTFYRFQPGAGKKHYIVHFETFPDGRCRPERRPVFVIAWKAEATKVAFGFERPEPAIAVNDRVLTPPANTRAIYALQADGSLQQLPLTEDEITRLFSHIARKELQDDERLAALIEKQDADVLHKACHDDTLFSADSSWEKKVDPHLKVVEPPK
jgi:hypothetical protein